MKVSSRTLHIPWDSAGCFCPVGDLFNYAAPGMESYSSEEIASWTQTSTSDSSSLEKSASDEELEVEHIDGDSLRLTDAGYEEQVEAYCFYARRRYRKGEQVHAFSFAVYLHNLGYYLSCYCKHSLL